MKPFVVVASVICLLIVGLLWVRGAPPFAKASPPPTREIPTSYAGHWYGVGIFYNPEGNKQAFLIDFEVPKTANSVEKIRVAYAYRYPLENSCDCKYGGAGTVPIISHSFQAAGDFCSRFIDAYTCQYEKIELKGTFKSTILVEGSFSSVIGSGNWEAASDGFWEWGEKN